MKVRLKKKLRKAENVYYHQPDYTPIEIMRSFYFWKGWLRRRDYDEYKKFKKEKRF